MIERLKDYTEGIDIPIAFDDRCVLLEELSDKNRIKLDKGAYFGNGATRDEYGRVTKSSVACMEAFDSENESLFWFIGTIVDIFHEKAHARQIEKFASSDTAIDRCIALNHYACKCSVGYYFGKNLSNYFTQPKEIAAQYAALHDGYRYFETLTGDGRCANDIICAYVNTRMSLGSEFIMASEPYGHVEDIYADFEKAFDKAKNMHRHLSFEDANDELSGYLGKRASTADKILTAINSVTANQDLLLTSIYIKQANEGNFVKNLKCFEGVAFPYSEISLSRFESYNKLARLADAIEKDEAEKRAAEREDDGETLYE